MVLMARKKPAHPNPWRVKLRKLKSALGDATDGQLAEKLGVTRRAVVYWLAGDKIPSPTVQLLIDCLLRQHES